MEEFWKISRKGLRWLEGPRGEGLSREELSVLRLLRNSLEDEELLGIVSEEEIEDALGLPEASYILQRLHRERLVRKVIFISPDDYIEV